jgi:hypothetical protein
VTIVLAKTKAGYEGTIQDSLGMVAPGTPILEPKQEGAVLSFAFGVTDGTSVAMRLTIEGAKMSGTWTHSQGDTGPIAFEKQKPAKSK